ncbi:hypothetical protein R21Y_13 [Vibrio phage vB_VhaS_R21Y]|nr:hypothetical protein R21Y_13 [Vibrio phage vB_VhaS_R21Y]
MKPSEFKSFDEETPEQHKHIIVTNNLSARDALGEMSHVWLTTATRKSEHKHEGRIAFISSMQIVTNLTHWKYA